MTRGLSSIFLFFPRDKNTQNQKTTHQTKPNQTKLQCACLSFCLQKLDKVGCMNTLHLLFKAGRGAGGRERGAPNIHSGKQKKEQQRHDE